MLLFLQVVLAILWSPLGYAASLRAIDKADILLKATSVDGIFDADPKHNLNANSYPMSLLMRR